MDYCVEAREAMRKYDADLKAGHAASEYWKGQAEAYSTICALGDGDTSMLLLHIMEHEVVGSGKVIDEAKARASPCRYFEYEGSRYAWSPGVLGLISEKKNPEQFYDFCSAGMEPGGEGASRHFGEVKEAIGAAHEKWEKRNGGLPEWWDEVAKEMEKRKIAF